MRHRILGVDPGSAPCLALIDTALSVVSVQRVHKTDDGYIDDVAIATAIAKLAPQVAYVERVQAFPGQGGSSAFDFGTSWGVVRGVLASLGIPVVLVQPNTWKVAVLKKRGCDMGPERPPRGTKMDPSAKRELDLQRRAVQKQSAITLVGQLFPTVSLIPPRCRKPDDDLADAMLIAEYGRMKEAGDV